MKNAFSLTALLVKTGELRYTPAGVPVLDVVLKHESEQIENGRLHKINFELVAKIVGAEAQIWQHRENIWVEAQGYLAQRSQRIRIPIMHIQQITEYKG